MNTFDIMKADILARYPRMPFYLRIKTSILGIPDTCVTDTRVMPQGEFSQSYIIREYRGVFYFVRFGRLD